MNSHEMTPNERLATASGSERARRFNSFCAKGCDGTNQTRTNNPVLDDSFDWSPDSRRIVFGSFHDGPFDFIGNISVMNADGSNVQRLTNYPGYDFSPNWSPDGRKIAFVRDDDYID